MVVDTNLSNHTIQIIKILDSFNQASSPSNVVSAFRGDGIRSKNDPEKEFLMLYIDRSCATKVRHWDLEKEITYDKKRISVDDVFDSENRSMVKKKSKKIIVPTRVTCSSEKSARFDGNVLGNTSAQFNGDALENPNMHFNSNPLVNPNMHFNSNPLVNLNMQFNDNPLVNPNI